MRALRSFVRRLLFSVKGNVDDEDLVAEVESHLQMETEANIRLGMSEAEARRAAALKFGAIESIKEEYREQRGVAALDGVRSDLRFTLRALKRSPTFAAVAILTLAVGIGVNTAVFTLTNAALFKGFPFLDNDRIFCINSKTDYGPVSFPDLEDWRTQAKSIDGIATIRDFQVSLSDDRGSTDTYKAITINSSIFRMIRQRPALGREFLSSDEKVGAPAATILSFRVWERQFGKSPDIIGHIVRINGVPTTVIGILPEGLLFPLNQDVWLPLTPTPEFSRRDARVFPFAVAHLAEGFTIEQARSEIQGIATRLAATYPDTSHGFAPVIKTVNEHFVGADLILLYKSMWGAVAFVLLIVCANMANLFLARTTARTREICVRIALGAGRWRIVRQLFIESVLLSICGGVVAWWIAKWGVAAYVAKASFYQPFGPDMYALDYRVFAYLIAISVGAGLLFALAPACRLSRLDMNAAIKDGSRGTTQGIVGTRLSDLLICAQVSLAVVLLAGAGLMIRSFINYSSADVGFNPKNVLVLGFDLPDARFPSTDSKVTAVETLKSRLAAIPGIESVALTERLPIGGSAKLQVELDDRRSESGPDRSGYFTVRSIGVSPDYFQTLGAEVLRGREFISSDGSEGFANVIVNQTFVKKFWAGQDPLGKHLRLFDQDPGGPWQTVVGVVSNIQQNDPTRQVSDPLVYLPFRANPQGSWVLVRTNVPPETVAANLRREVQALNPDLPDYGVTSLVERLQYVGGYQARGVNTTLFVIFAAIAILLASVGLYAVLAHSVSRSTQDIGIRIAIGATPGDIRRLIVSQVTIPLVLGLGIGLLGSFGVNRFLKAEMIGVSGNDAWTRVLAALILIGSAAVGCWLPARSATRVDAMSALKHE